LRDDDPAGPSSRQSPKGWGRLGEWSPGSAGAGDDSGQVAGAMPSQAAPAGPASVRGRAITVGPASGQAAAGPAAAVDGAPRAAAPATAIPLGGLAPAAAASSIVHPDLAYGQADPGYGPPGPDWYRGSAEAPAESAATEHEAQAAESLTKRGPFEPIHREELASAGQRTEGGDGDPAAPGADLPEMPEFDPIGGEPADLLDLGPDDPADGPLGGLRDLYQKAEAVGFDRLESSLDRLLERQRKLITDYFTESGGSHVVDLDAPQASIGFDSAESLVGLRSELRTSR
jgi:hypothetical protein